MATGFRCEAAIVLAFCCAVGCSDDNQGNPGDVGTEADADVPTDTPTDTPADVTSPAYSTCIKSCATPDDCCLESGVWCGDYPNRWACEGVCRAEGCTDTAECVTWATDLGIPGADGYRCSTTMLYYSADLCTPGCATAADCCPTGVDCSAYPRRRVCDGGACKFDGCTDDAECRTWASGLGLPSAASWVCRNAPYTDASYCTVACTADADCCPGGCLAYPDRLACIGGYCAETCLDDAECQGWATDSGLADPGAYVCHAFTF